MDYDNPKCNLLLVPWVSSFKFLSGNYYASHLFMKHGLPDEDDDIGTWMNRVYFSFS
jgi:hypothetical protein